jgi:aminopeptidase
MSRTAIGQFTSVPPSARAYPQTGGQNRSRLHWDLVADLRNGGQVELDGTLANKDGVWL